MDSQSPGDRESTQSSLGEALAGLIAPPAHNPADLVVQVSHLQHAQAALIAGRMGRSPDDLADLQTNADYKRYIKEHG